MHGLKMPQARNSCFFFSKLDSISLISLMFKMGPVPYVSVTSCNRTVLIKSKKISSNH